MVIGRIMYLLNMSRQIEAGSKTLSSKTRKLLILLSVLESATARKEYVYVPVYKQSSKTDCSSYARVLLLPNTCESYFIFFCQD